MKNLVSQELLEFGILNFSCFPLQIQTLVWVLIVSARGDVIRLNVVKGMLHSISMHLYFKFICAAQRCE